MAESLQWLAVAIEFTGLLLIGIELYFPSAADGLRSLFDGTVLKVGDRELGSRGYWGVGVYLLVWIIAAVIVSLTDPAMSLLINVFFSVITVILLGVAVVARLMIRLGVLLGRGNSVGGVGLVLAVIGISLEISQIS